LLFELTFVNWPFGCSISTAPNTDMWFLLFYLRILLLYLSVLKIKIIDIFAIVLLRGHEVVQLAEALRYKPEVRGLDSGWCHWNFSLT
jgi:hypothetical protein